MTLEQKQTIWTLRRNGYSFGRIAEEMNLSRNTVKSYCYRESVPTGHGKADITICKNCGKRIVTANRQKSFCSDHCRWNWWNQHRRKP